MTIEELKDRKCECGYTNEDVSRLSGVPLGTVQKIFAGITKHPRYDTLRALEGVLRPSSEAEAASAMIREESAEYLSGSGTVHTIKDYYSLPEGKRAELIDGRFYDLAAPSSMHQMLCLELAHQLLSFIRFSEGNCVPFTSPIDVQLDRDDKTMLQPDIAVVCDRSAIRKNCIYGAPDLIIEILSPATRSRDMYTKLAKYRNAGVREYWMVDPDRKQVVVYDFSHDDAVAIYGFDAKVPVGIYDGECVVDFADLYERIEFLLK